MPRFRPSLRLVDAVLLGLTAAFLVFLVVATLTTMPDDPLL